MNHDYLIDGTPAVARQLVRLSAVVDVELDDRIIDIAAKDLISPEVFASLPQMNDREQKAVQRLVDHNMRAVLLSGSDIESAYRVVLAAAKISGAHPITANIGKHSLQWLRTARSFGLAVGNNPDLDRDILLTSELLDAVTEERRAGLFVSDETVGADPGGTLSIAAYEHPRTILVIPTAAMVKDYSRWFAFPEVAQAAAILHGQMTVGPLTNNSIARRSKLQPRGFRRNHPRDLAFLYNVVDELIDASASDE